MWGPALVTEDAWTFPASFGQERLWLASQLDPGSSVYTVWSPVVLPFATEADDVVSALGEVVRRHETLRTSLHIENGALVQVIHASLRLRVERFDLTDLPPDERRHRANAMASADARQAIPLDHAPLWRARLIRLDRARWYLVFVAHHAIFDAASHVNLEAELTELCRAAVERRPARLPELRVQYADFAVWQRKTVSGRTLEAHLAYWRERLAGLPVTHAIPLDRPRPPRITFAGDEQRFPLPERVVERASQLAQQWRVTLFTVLLAAYAALLHRLSGQPEVVVGVPVAGRETGQVEPLIGMFVNTLVLRLDTSGDPLFTELVERAREATLNAMEHGEVPFQTLVETLAPRRDPAVPPLYQVAFNFLTGSGLDHSHGTAREELLLELTDREGRLSYRSDLFDAATARLVAERYVRLLAAAVEDPAVRLSRFDLLGEEERALVVERWNATAAPVPDEATVPHLVRDQAVRRPDAIAVCDSAGALTYRGLCERSAELAHRLHAMGAGPERLVAVALPRSVDLAVAVLAVLDAGAAFVPIDPEYPPERVAMMLADSEPAATITSSALRASLPPELPGVLRIDDAHPGGEPPALPPLDGARPDGLAYVIYTSGSTGRPKGVMIQHRSLVNYVTWFNRQFGIDSDDRILASSSPSFDAFGIELYPALVAGATVVMAPEGPLDPQALLRTAAAEGVTMLALVPTVVRLLADQPGLEDCTVVRQVICGGEQLTGDVAASLWERLPVPLHNLYGPTEATIDVSYHTCKPGPRPDGPVPIGRPLANVRLYVLTGEADPAPVGVPGHLHVGGVAVGRGYLGRPAETAAAFVPDPFGPPGSRLYRTGDLARWRTDGALEFLGRIDSQVKLHGHRIEPGEIESALRGLRGVRDAIVVLRDDAQGAELVAYVVPDGRQPPAPALRAALQRLLPEHMVPSAFVAIDAVPLTPNGKLDVSALPAPGRGEREYVAPRTECEQLVASVWAEVLGRERVGARDHFFELGGQSLLAIRAMSMLSEAVEVEVPIHALFSHPRLDDLAREVERLLLADISELSEDEAVRLVHEDEG